MNSIELPYLSGKLKYKSLHKLMSLDWSMLLDSGNQITPSTSQKSLRYRRYDICVTHPTVRLTYKDNKLTVKKNSSTKQLISQSPLPEMRLILDHYKKKTNTQICLNKLPDDLPFNGGWLGYLSYDFGKNKNLESEAQIDDLSVPLIQMGLYQWAIITDHLKQTTVMYNFGLNQIYWSKQISIVKSSLKQIESSTNTPMQLTTPFKADIKFQQYKKAFNKIQQYIHAGDCYQVNFAQRFTAHYSGDPFDIYALLAEENNAPFSAYLNIQDQKIMSLSPERFIDSHKGQVITQPIKGTLPRSKDKHKDKQLADKLKHSIKDKAENLMIVDLLRNDLSKTAAKGSVKVSELFSVYQFESVHHLISTIESTLDSKYDNFDLLETTLPGGSITGAPKIRAMQIIEELEKNKRGIYCGVIGYLDFKNNMDTNICIRTLLAKKNKLYCWAGGGLVADSKLDPEYQEVFDKLSKILPTLDKLSK